VLSPACGHWKPPDAIIYSAICVRRSADTDGRFVVRFVDFPEAITQGESIEQALNEAADCLEEAIANRIAMGLPIPDASSVKKGQHVVTLPVQIAAKAALYLAIQEVGITKTELARRMDCNEKEVRRLLDPRHSSKIPRIETAMSLVGKRLIIGFENAA
jgi:antitoxin HicB